MRSVLRSIPALLLPMLLCGCVFGGGGDRDAAPPPRARAGQALSGAFKTPDLSAGAVRQCEGRLSADGYDFRSLPDREMAGGCEIRGAVQLLDIGVPATGLTAMRCDLAEAFANWITHGVRPAAIQILGSDVVKIETFGTYACRPIVGGSGPARLSEHARANAVDVAGFTLADGRRITVQKDWKSNDPAIRRFMDVIHASACKRFETVLSPDYNAEHYNHFHLDMGRGPFCR